MYCVGGAVHCIALHKTITKYVQHCTEVHCYSGESIQRCLALLGGDADAEDVSHHHLQLHIHNHILIL